MLITEERTKAEDFMERFKLSVVSANPQVWVPKMFPNWQQSETEKSEDLNLDGDTSGTWVFENQDVTPEQAEQAFADVVAEGGGVLTWDDLNEADGEWQ